MNTTSSIISFRCPAPGNGVNTAILKAAWDCKRQGLSPEGAEREILSWISRVPRTGEIARAVQAAYKEKLQSGAAFSKPIKEGYNPKELQRVAGKIASSSNSLQYTRLSFLTLCPEREGLSYGQVYQS